MPARLSIIRTTAQLGDMDKAFAEMKKLQSEMKEDRADVWYTRGWLNVKAGKLEPAVKALQKSLSLQPSPETALVLFTAMNSQGRTDEALTLLADWSDKFPESRTLMVVLGQSYLAQNATDKAIAVYQRLLAVDPQSVLALNNLAWLTREKDPKQALDYANRGNAIAPADPFMMSTFGTLLAENGKPADGEQMLRKAVKLYPDNIQLKLDLGRLLLKIGKPDAAKPYLESVIGQGNDALVAEAKDLLLTMSKGG
jgi:FimV-like protein